MFKFFKKLFGKKKETMDIYTSERGPEGVMNIIDFDKDSYTTNEAIDLMSLGYFMEVVDMFDRDEIIDIIHYYEGKYFSFSGAIRQDIKTLFPWIVRIKYTPDNVNDLVLRSLHQDLVNDPSLKKEDYFIHAIIDADKKAGKYKPNTFDGDTISLSKINEKAGGEGLNKNKRIYPPNIFDGDTLSLSKINEKAGGDNE